MAEYGQLTQYLYSNTHFGQMASSGHLDEMSCILL